MRGRMLIRSYGVIDDAGRMDQPASADVIVYVEVRTMI